MKSIQIGIIKKKYRIIIQQKPTKYNKKENMKSFMIYDYTGKTTTTKIKEKLLKLK